MLCSQKRLEKHLQGKHLGVSEESLVLERSQDKTDWEIYLKGHYYASYSETFTNHMEVG